MSPQRRHKCTSCGRTRSTTFHRQFPAGPGYPQVQGICRRCRNRDSSHIHHYHWIHLTDNDREPGCQVHRWDYHPTPPLRDRIRPEGPARPDAPPPYTAELPDESGLTRIELPERHDSVHGWRAELPASGASDMGRIFTNRLQREPPPVGPKPSLRLIAELMRLFHL
ncbi:hypothetical protein BX600DRAFT_526839 [Xylariales sp. PMI_506]|nr:hypothetical protein BX600DRAFT_526839 [Xylariales sp. PMI_506]